MTTTSMMVSRAALAAVAISTILAMGGCATAPPPIEQMAVSRAAMDDAISAGSAEYATAEFRTAQERLAAATAAFTAGDYARAQWLAEDAEVDAKVAATRARSVKAQRAVAEVHASIRALQSELARR